MPIPLILGGAAALAKLGAAAKLAAGASTAAAATTAATVGSAAVGKSAALGTKAFSNIATNTGKYASLASNAAQTPTLITPSVTQSMANIGSQAAAFKPALGLGAAQGVAPSVTTNPFMESFKKQAGQELATRAFSKKDEEQPFQQQAATGYKNGGMTSYQNGGNTGMVADQTANNFANNENMGGILGMIGLGKKTKMNAAETQMAINPNMFANPSLNQQPKMFKNGGKTSSCGCGGNGCARCGGKMNSSNVDDVAIKKMSKKYKSSKK